MLSAEVRSEKGGAGPEEPLLKNLEAPYLKCRCKTYHEHSIAEKRPCHDEYEEPEEQPEPDGEQTEAEEEDDSSSDSE